MWILFALLSALFAALVAIFGKIGLKNVDSTAATTVRAAVMLLTMLVLLLALRKAPALSQIHGKTIVWIVLSGIVGALSWYFYFLALKHGTASGVSAVDRLSVVMTIILAAVFLGEKLTPLHALGGAFIVGGALLLIH